MLRGDAEKEKWTSIDYHYMTEELESDDDSVIRQHKLQWRSQGWLSAMPVIAIKYAPLLFAILQS